MIAKPSRRDPVTERETECQQALRDAFHAMRERAEAAGWNAEEVSRALLALSTEHIRARVSRSAVKWAIHRRLCDPAGL